MNQSANQHPKYDINTSHSTTTYQRWIVVGAVWPSRGRFDENGVYVFGADNAGGWFNRNIQVEMFV